MEVYLPRNAIPTVQQGKNSTSSQRYETEAPVTMVMAIGDERNEAKRQFAQNEYNAYRRALCTGTAAELLATKVSVLDMMSYVEYGDGLCLPAEVGVVSGCGLGSGSGDVYHVLPLIEYSDLRMGFAYDAKVSCEKIHGINLCNNAFKTPLTELCVELKGQLSKDPIILCRSEDLSRVLGSYYYLQDHPAGQAVYLHNLRILTIEDFVRATLMKLAELCESTTDLPTFGQLTLLLTNSKGDMNPDFRCSYHKTDIEDACDKTGCAKKNVLKYQDIIHNCLRPLVSELRDQEQKRLSSKYAEEQKILQHDTAAVQLNGAYQQASVMAGYRSSGSSQGSNPGSSPPRTGCRSQLQDNVQVVKTSPKQASPILLPPTYFERKNSTDAPKPEPNTTSTPRTDSVSSSSPLPEDPPLTVPRKPVSYSRNRKKLTKFCADDPTKVVSLQTAGATTLYQSNATPPGRVVAPAGAPSVTSSSVTSSHGSRSSPSSVRKKSPASERRKSPTLDLLMTAEPKPLNIDLAKIMTEGEDPRSGPMTPPPGLGPVPQYKEQADSIITSLPRSRVGSSSPPLRRGTASSSSSNPRTSPPVSNTSPPLYTQEEIQSWMKPVSAENHNLLKKGLEPKDKEASKPMKKRGRN